MRKPIIAGNWKMNNTASQGVALVKAIAPLVEDAECDVVVCVPAIDIPAVGEALKGTKIALGAQNVHFAEKGAYTGEISASMLKEYGVEYVIIGHSERRQYFGETDETVNKRTLCGARRGAYPHRLHRRIPGRAGDGQDGIRPRQTDRRGIQGHRGHQKDRRRL